MKKLKLFAIPIIVGGIILGTMGVAHAAESITTPPVVAQSQNDLETDLDDLKEVAELELIPDTIPGRRVHLAGGFKGVWVKENELSDVPPGKVTGLYGRVEYSNGRSFGFFGGIWKDGAGRTTGYLRGKYEDGSFRGWWRSFETDAGGPVSGRYIPFTDAAENDGRHYFYGKWETEDGQASGYLRGSWSPIETLRPLGRFNGQWATNSLTNAADIAAAGRLSGAYGLIQLNDGNTLQYFRGRWNSVEGAQGRLGGLIVGDDFYGLWNGGGAGYLKGDWAQNRFRGTWGYFGHNVKGRLWGSYGPLITPSPLQARDMTATKQRIGITK